MTGRTVRSFTIIGGMLISAVLGGAALLSQETAPDPSGTWDITLSFICGTAAHTAVIARRDSILTGTYRGSSYEGRLAGKVRGNAVEFTGSLRIQAQTISFRYAGTIEKDSMKGTLDMGEYWTGTFTAKKTGK